MKNLNKLFFIIIVSSISVFAQNEARVSMGINFINCSSVRDYINQNFAPHGQEVGSFHTGVDFSAEYGRLISDDFQLGIQYSYLINSYSIPTPDGQYELSSNLQSPSLMGYYVIDGEGYRLKIGGGVGPRFVSVSEKVFTSSSSGNFTSTGFGLVASADGSTALGGDFYAYIGGELKLDFNGEPKKNNEYISSPVSGKINLNSFSAVVKLGITYLF